MPTPPGNDDRVAMRKRLRERRAMLTPVERIRATGSLVAQLEAIPEFLIDLRIAGYWAIDGELPLAAALGGLRARGQSFHLPVISGDLLHFAAWQAGDAIVNNRFGIPEPDVGVDVQLDANEMDLVLVPLLAFDRAGRRLGFGGGFYDRTFAFLSDRHEATRPLLVGVGFACQEVPSINHMPWDVPLDFVATETELIQCLRLPQ